MQVLARQIDHTLLTPEATPNQIIGLCQEATRHGFANVCVNPSYVSLAAGQLAHSDVGVCAVVGFPLGASHSEVKQAEASRAVLDGASELDMVIAIGRLIAREMDYVLEEIGAVVESSQGRMVKVILETGLLEPHEIELGCRLAVKGGARFVKTSTGFGPSGATVEGVALMRRTVGNEIGVKAAGGVRDARTARRLLQAGANRLGTSASLKILSEMSRLP
jgi:deoxyribose-phosphate aldolase